MWTEDLRVRAENNIRWFFLCVFFEARGHSLMDCLNARVLTRTIQVISIALIKVYILCLDSIRCRRLRFHARLK